MPPLDIAAYCAQGGSVPQEHRWYCRQLVEQCAYAEGERLCSAAHGYGTARFGRCKEALIGALWTRAADPRVRRLLSTGTAQLTLPGCGGKQKRFSSAAQCAVGARSIAARCAPQGPTIAAPWTDVLDAGQDRALGYMRLRPRVAHRLLRVRTPLVLLIGTRRESCSRCRQWLYALTRLRAQEALPHLIVFLEWEAFSDAERLKFFRTAQLPFAMDGEEISLNLPVLFAREGKEFIRIEHPHALSSGNRRAHSGTGKKIPRSMPQTSPAPFKGTRNDRWRPVTMEGFDTQLSQVGEGSILLIGMEGEALTQRCKTVERTAAPAHLLLTVDRREIDTLVAFCLKHRIPLEVGSRGRIALPQAFRYLRGRFVPLSGR